MQLKVDLKILRPLARKYIWWKTTDEALLKPERVIAQIMDVGDYEDMWDLLTCVGKETLREILIHAQAGQFSRRSWVYWHYRLDLATVDQVPDLPMRKLM